jgi:hypothetical protein
MTKCNSSPVVFTPHGSRKIEADFTGGSITSAGGAPLLREMDRHLGLTRAAAAGLPDPRQRGKVDHSLQSLVRQRVYALALGYEDLNDHGQLRYDLALQSAVGHPRELASPPTLCRLENRADRKGCRGLSKVLVEQFIATFDRPPQELVLDFDATDVPIHGHQAGRFFHGYYDAYCFLPLYVFCGDHLLVAYLRPSRNDAARHAGAILKLLVQRLRHAWPGVRIVLRADSGFCRDHIMSWCERHEVGYLLGLAKNSVLNRMAEPWMEQARLRADGKTSVRIFADLRYGAQTWTRSRRVILKAERLPDKDNHRYLVTNLTDGAQYLYEVVYCARGEAENRIKEQQLDLFASRTSCHAWWANQFRLLLSALAYTLMEAIRRTALHGTELADATCATIRLRLFKIGAVVVRNTRRIRFMLSGACPWQNLFRLAAARLSTA